MNSSIVTLDISYNPNIKNLPPNLSLPAISTLLISHNEIRQFPKSVMYYKSLVSLDLSANRIESLDSSIENLTNLKILNLSDNLLSDIPESAITSLRINELNLSNNRFFKVPLSLSKQLRSTLRTLEMSFCRIENFPYHIVDLIYLTVLRFAGNKMIGDIPSGVKELHYLEELDCRGNQLGVGTSGEIYDIMETLASCRNLKILLLDGNCIGGKGRSQAEMSFDSTDGFEINLDELNSVKLDFPALTKLSMANQNTSVDNSLYFYFSNSSGSLRHLNLSNCGIENLPKDLFRRFLGLEMLYLDGNKLRELPTLFFNSSAGENWSPRIGLSKLRELHIANNNLEYLPDEIGDLNELELLDFHSNLIREIPSVIWDCPKLQSINGTCNLLERFSPPQVDDMPPTESQIQSPRLGPLINPLSVEVRRSSSLARSATSIRSANTTPIPSIQAPLSSVLQFLYLADNRLTDSLVDALRHMPELLVLNCAFNEITDITTWVKRSQVTPWYQQLRELHLAGNLISQLPVEIVNLRNLRWLFLNANKLSSITGEISKLGKLIGFDVGTQMGSKGEGTGLRYNVTNWVI
ncbi:cysteinyl-tRNA synthetase [Nowakowskiella sp. JEL0078]|nr:cysteinyl-tRNA synthetase [Nowakowskiella sp. JEL0078]